MGIGTGRISGGSKFLGSSSKGYEVSPDRGQALAAIAQRKAAAEAKGNEKEASTWALIAAVVAGGAAAYFAGPTIGAKVGASLMAAAGAGQIAYGATKLSQDDPSGTGMLISGLATAGMGAAKYGVPQKVAFSQEAIQGLYDANLFAEDPALRADALKSLNPEQMAMFQQNPEMMKLLLGAYQGQPAAP
jgi:hypothetical protein